MMTRLLASALALMIILSGAPVDTGFLCATTTASGSSRRDVACHRIGPIALRMTREEAETHLGKVRQALGGNTPPGYWHYDLHRSKEQTGTFAIVGYDAEDHVFHLQITGDKWPGNWAFKGVKLGDSEAMVVDRLGKLPANPLVTGIGSVRYEYSPTVTIEIFNGVVSAMRVKLNSRD